MPPKNFHGLDGGLPGFPLLELDLHFARPQGAHTQPLLAGCDFSDIEVVLRWAKPILGFGCTRLPCRQPVGCLNRMLTLQIPAAM